MLLWIVLNWQIQNLKIRNRVVLINKTPTGLVRGFGGPQVYYALERLIQKIAKSLAAEKIETDSDKEIIALIAYLQRVGTDIKMMPQTASVNK